MCSCSYLLSFASICTLRIYRRRRVYILNRIRCFWVAENILAYLHSNFFFVRSFVAVHEIVERCTFNIGRRFFSSLVCSLDRLFARSFFFFFSRFDGSLVCFRLCVGIFSSKLDCDCKYECVLCVCLWLSRSLSPRVCDMKNMCVHISIYIGVWWPSFVCDDSYTMPLVYQHLKI